MADDGPPSAREGRERRPGAAPAEAKCCITAAGRVGERCVGLGRGTHSTRSPIMGGIWQNDWSIRPSCPARPRGQAGNTTCTGPANIRSWARTRAVVPPPGVLLGRHSELCPHGRSPPELWPHGNRSPLAPAPAPSPPIHTPSASAAKPWALRLGDAAPFSAHRKGDMSAYLVC